jgi:hypothetical protein
MPTPKVSLNCNSQSHETRSRALMQAATPTITPEELVKLMADPETYSCGSIVLLGKVHTSASCPSSLCSPLSPQGSATSSCDDTPKWRETLAAREEVKKRQCQMKQRLTSSARSSSSHLPRPSLSTRWKAVSRRLEQARMSRQTFASPFVMAGMLAWLAGGRMILSSQTRPLGRKSRKSVTHLLCISNAVVVYCSRRRQCRMVIGGSSCW